MIAYFAKECQNVQNSLFVRYSSNQAPRMRDNHISTDHLASTTPNVINDSVNNLSEKDVYNNQNDTTDAIESSFKYDSSNVDKRGSGGEKRQSCGTKLNCPPDTKPIESSEKDSDSDTKISE